MDKKIQWKSSEINKARPLQAVTQSTVSMDRTPTECARCDVNTHTHTHPFNGPFPGLPR